MREAELRARLATHLGGAYSTLWVDTFVLSGLEHRTVSQALSSGVPCKRIWLEAWRELELPEAQR